VRVSTTVGPPSWDCRQLLLPLLLGLVTLQLTKCLERNGNGCRQPSSLGGPTKLLRAWLSNIPRFVCFVSVYHILLYDLHGHPPEA
jgi:hypothetical protein